MNHAKLRLLIEWSQVRVLLGEPDISNAFRQNRVSLPIEKAAVAVRPLRRSWEAERNGRGVDGKLPFSMENDSLGRVLPGEKRELYRLGRPVSGSRSPDGNIRLPQTHPWADDLDANSVE